MQASGRAEGGLWVCSNSGPYEHFEAAICPESRGGFRGGSEVHWGVTNESYTAEKGEIRVPARGDRRLGRHAMSELGWVVDLSLIHI